MSATVIVSLIGERTERRTNDPVEFQRCSHRREAYAPVDCLPAAVHNDQWIGVIQASTEDKTSSVFTLHVRARSQRGTVQNASGIC
jgi:hypothetical protein